MQRVTLGMLRGSILCGFKGANNFLIGAIIAANGGILAKAGPSCSSIGPLKRRQGLYGIYNNVVPALEVLLCMGLICFLLERFAFRGVRGLDLKARVAISVAICMLLMFLICLLLRVTGKRKDCCGDYDYDKSYRRVGGYGLHFRIPKKAGDRDMLTELLNFEALKFSHWDSFKDNGKGIEHISKRAVLLHFLGALAVWPLFVIMLAFNLLELPPVFLIDCITLCFRKTDGIPFSGSRSVLCQILFDCYQLTEPVICLLPEATQRGIGGGFASASSRILRSVASRIVGSQESMVGENESSGMPSSLLLASPEEEISADLEEGEPEVVPGEGCSCVRSHSCESPFWGQ